MMGIEMVVCVYIDETIKSYELSGAVFNLSKIEQIWATVYFGTDKYLVGCICKSNGFVDMSNFDQVFKQAKEMLIKKDKKIY